MKHLLLCGLRLAETLDAKRPLPERGRNLRYICYLDFPFNRTSAADVRSRTARTTRLASKENNKLVFRCFLGVLYSHVPSVSSSLFHQRYRCFPDVFRQEGETQGALESAIGEDQVGQRAKVASQGQSKAAQAGEGPR